MVFSIGKKIFFGILFMTLLALGVGVGGSLLCRSLRQGAEAGTAAGAALEAVTQTGVRFAREGSSEAAMSGLSSLTAKVSEAAGAGLPAEVAERVAAQIARAQRAARTEEHAAVVAALAEAASLLAAEGRNAQEALIARSRSGESLSLILAGLATLLGLVMSFALSRRTLKPLYQVIDGLQDGARQTASASAQVAASAQEVAKGAADQAASLEQTSAAVEELTAMVKQNAGHSAEAGRLVEQADGLMRQAREVMRETTQAMQGISTASEEAAKVVKTIDEIAFQTNLLALNAAVEAARAGEAGMGFAVVADEVRSLAQRSAAAARDTTELILTTLNRIKEGKTLVKKADDAYREVALASREVSKLVTEIAAASKEQAQGVEQISTAIVRVDRVTQGNAASAEESASASEQLTAQAAAIERIVAELRAVVGLGAEEDGRAGQEPVRFQAFRPAPVAAAPVAPTAAAPQPLRASLPTRAPSAKEVFPLDDQSFQDF